MKKILLVSIAITICGCSKPQVVQIPVPVHARESKIPAMPDLPVKNLKDDSPYDLVAKSWVASLNLATRHCEAISKMKS